MAEWTVSQGGGGASVVEFAEMSAEANFELGFLPLAVVFAGPAELGSESNFVLVEVPPESARPELESDPNSATVAYANSPSPACDVCATKRLACTGCFMACSR